jgi:multidrug efflux pump subunit AcrA (membrane-fusion protein)
MQQQLRPGEKAQPGMILATLCAPSAVVCADLPEANYHDAFANQPASVAPVSLPDDKLVGSVRTKGIVGKMKGPGPSYEVLIELKQQKADILPGMKAKVTLTGNEMKDVVVVPSDAVTSNGNKHTVSVSKDGKNAAREVQVGRTDGKLTHIKEGLEAGEKIVLPKKQD